jgi:hypothetical protein
MAYNPDILLLINYLESHRRFRRLGQAALAFANAMLWLNNIEVKRKRSLLSFTRQICCLEDLLAGFSIL